MSTKSGRRPQGRWRSCPGLALAALVWLAAAPAAAQQTHLLVVTGLGGEADYTEQFHEWATTLLDAAATRYDVPAANITYLGEKPDLDPARIADRSSRENVAAAVDAIAARADPGDHVVIVLFGHGSFADTARINLPGRDLSADDFAGLLDRLDVGHVTFVNTASASGPFVEKLSGANRVVMTATRTGGERNASVFGGFFVEAFAAEETAADQNRDERVSMLEAFEYARLKVEQSFEADGRIATEHALLDDNGDGAGSGEPDPLGGDGTVARTLFFTSGAALQDGMAFPGDPELVALYEERRALEERVDELRRIRGAEPSEQYAQELERLLVDLALKSREIRQREAEQEP